MAFVGIDPDRTRTLVTTMRVASDGLNELAAEVTATLSLSELDSIAPSYLGAEATELDKVAAVLDTRADLADGFEIDIEKLADALGITEDEAQSAVDVFVDPAFNENSGNPLLSLVADDHHLFDELPQSIRQMFVGLPAEGSDAELDKAVNRLDGAILGQLLTGGSIDTENLTNQQNADLKLVAAALGGDRLTVSRTEREKYSGGHGDDEYRTVTKQIPITDLGPAAIASFVQNRLDQGVAQRQATADLVRATANIDRSDIGGAAADLGITEEELNATLAATDLLVAANEGRLSTGDEPGTNAESSDPSFPDRADFPEGEQGDRDYITAVEQDRLDAVNRGDNVVGPVGSEQDAFYEAMGSVFGSQNFAFSHDYQATQAEIENINDPGLLGVDFPNAVTATVGYAATVVTAPAVAAINGLFGTDIDIAVVGTAIADVTWSAFGYDVTAPTIAESQAARDLAEEKQRQQARDDFDNDSARRDNLARDGIDPSVRDDDFSGDQNTGPGGIL